MNDNPIIIKGNEITIKSSLIDYLEPINGGIPISICFTILEFTFQGIYFIHPNNNYFLEIEPNFLKLWGCSDTQSLPFYEELCKDIEKILPIKEDIFKEILK